MVERLGHFLRCLAHNLDLDEAEVDGVRQIHRLVGHDVAEDAQVGVDNAALDGLLDVDLLVVVGRVDGRYQMHTLSY